MSTGWRDSDVSEDDGNHNTQSVRKRSSRACDQCRKSKSKCERPSEDSSDCSSCILARTSCTYLGPSYKRGPPKGYIHAIEQRWHQVESLLGAIIACPSQHVQEIISGLRGDDLARDIVGRVANGPFGPIGRLNRPADATKEDMLASIFYSHEGFPARDANRSRRQSRLSREIVSSLQDNLVSPTTEWQDNLSKQLAASIESSRSSSNPDWNSLSGGPVTASPTTSFGMLDTSMARKRWITKPESDLPEPELNKLYSMDTESGVCDTTCDGAYDMGHISREVHYHGKASSLDSYQLRAFNTYECDDLVRMRTNTDTSTQLMAHMLGLDIPDRHLSASYSSEHEPSSSSSSSSMHTFSTSPTGSTQDTSLWLHDRSGSIPDFSFDLPSNDFGI